MRHLVLLFLLLFTFNAKAQEDVGGFFHAKLSYLQPTGNFASADSKTEGSGYALPGAGTAFQFGNRIYGGFGITFQSSVQVNFLDAATFENQLNSLQSAFSWSMKPAYWRTAGISIGPHYSVNLKRWEFDARVLTGPLSFYSPSITITGTSNWKLGMK